MLLKLVGMRKWHLIEDAPFAVAGRIYLRALSGQHEFKILRRHSQEILKDRCPTMPQ